MTQFKPGTRAKSVACTTEVMVIKHDGAATIECGGLPMIEASGAAIKAELDPNFSGGTLIGKRYQNAAGTIELLCVKAGQGSLSADLQELTIKSAKPLPSSD